MSEQKSGSNQGEAARQMENNLFSILNSFDKQVVARNGKTQNICVEKPDDFGKALYDYGCRFEHGILAFPCGDSNTLCLAAMGATLLSWSISISKAKICDANREGFASDNERKKALDDCKVAIKEYMDTVLTLSLDIAPRFNAKNTSLCVQSDAIPKNATQTKTT